MALHSAKQNVANMQWLSASGSRSHLPRTFADQSSPSSGSVLHPRRTRKHFGNMGTRPWKGERLGSEFWRVCVP